MQPWRTAWARRHLRTILNLWPPLLFAGVRITRLDPDFRAVTVELRMHWWNQNYVGTHFGGTLFSMTDPFYMLMLMENLGRGYVVWDKAASIRYRKPGKGTVRAEFRLTAEQIDAIRAQTESGAKVEPTFTVQVVDSGGEVVAEVEKVLHIRRKPVRSPA